MGLIFLLLFIAVPLIEIMLFIKIGGTIGMTMTVLVVIVTALIGTFMLRTQGLATMRGAQASMDEGELPVDPVIHGIFLLIAGAFLLTPGFLTDGIGFALFLPPLRLALGRKILSAVMARGSVNIHASQQTWQTGGHAGGRQGGPGRAHPGANDGHGRTIEGEASEVEDDKN